MELQRVVASAILFLLTALFAWGQYAPLDWYQTGVPVRQGYHINWQRAGVEDEDGNAIYAWADARSGDRNVYAQKVSPEGDKLWGDEGVTVISSEGHQQDPCLISTGFGDCIIIWSDFRDDSLYGDLYAQKLDANGLLQWDVTGILLSTGDMTALPATLRLVADGTGGAIVLWEDVRNGNEDIYAIRVTADGTIPPEWPENGLAVADFPYNQRQITADCDGRGGAIIAWMDDQNMGIQLRDIYMQRVTIDGQLAWNPSTGVPVCQADYDQDYPKLCQDGLGGAYVVWEDERGGSQGDLYFHHVSDSGTMVFPEPNGKPLIVENRGQWQSHIVADGSGNAIIIWMDRRNDPFFQTNDIYAQKVNSVGDKLWDPNGNAVCTDTSDQREVRIKAEGTGSAICSWMDERDGNEYYANIFAQKINGNGSMAWTTDGVAVCEAPGRQEDPLVLAFTDYSLIAWGDQRSGSPGIWYQKLDSAGAPQLTVDGDTLMWGISGSAYNVKLVKGGNGKTFVFFQDGREWTAGPTAYVQIMDTTGNAYLEANGRPICPEPLYTNNKDQGEIDACNDGAGGAIAVWEDERDSNPYGHQIYAQRIDPSGELMWGASGMQVSAYNNHQFEPRIVADEEGGAIVVWDEYSDPYYNIRICAARIDQGGNVLWAVTIADTLYYNFLEDIAPDGEGGVYICYQSVMWPDYNLYGQHVDASGNLLWGEYRFPVCTAEEMQCNGRVASLGFEGAIFVWADERNLSVTGQDLYAQRISYSGESLWTPDGIVVNNTANDQFNHDLSLDGQGHLYITWVDHRNYFNLDIYLQKLDLDGNLLYPDSGLAVCTAYGEQTCPRILSDGSSGNYIIWVDRRSGWWSDIYGTHLDADGALSTATVPGWPGQWVENGNIVCDAYHSQSGPEIIIDDGNGVVVVWEDKRSSPMYEEVDNVYAQRLKGHVVGVDLYPPKNAKPTAFRLYPSFPNPFNSSVKIRFELPSTSLMNLAVYDISGRQVATLANGWRNTGNHEMTFDGSNLSSGLYFCRIQAGDFSAVNKMMLIK